MKQLTQRDKRAIVLMAVSAVLIFGYFMVFEPALVRYRSLRDERNRLQKQLDRLTKIKSGIGAAQFKELADRVPVFEMPADAAQQGVLFRDELTRQLEKAGIQARTLQMRDNRGKRQDGFSVLTVDCQGRCSYEQMLQVLADLKRNPYYVGVEKFSLRVDTRNRNEMTFQLAVFTYAK
jgi:Tfp pilus assembly protein PilO